MMQTNQDRIERRKDEPRATKAAETAAREPRGFAPPVDVLESTEGILIVADMPGVRSEDLHIALDGSALTLEGRPAGRDFVLRRSFQIPSTIDGEGIAAELRNGVLSLRLPKRKDAKPRRIEVKSGE